jgi:ribosome-binding protein aMBF1 (putative translation factor)
MQKRGDAKEKLNRAVAAAVAELRHNAGLSQEGLAEHSEMHSTYISKLERGIMTPTLYSVFDLAKALKIKPHELVRRIEEIL